MPDRVFEVVRLAEQIVRTPVSRSQVVELSAALVQAYVSCMAAMLGTRKPRREPAKCVSMARAAKILGIPEYTARELGRKGEIPTVNFGRDVRVPLVALRRLVREKANGMHPRATREVDARLQRRFR